MTIDFTTMGRWFTSDEPTPETLYREEYMTERRAGPAPAADEVSIPPDFGMLEAARLLRAAGVAPL